MKPTHTIKRYQNRKLYDTTRSRYVTLEDIAELIRQGEDVKVIDNKTGDDLTSVTLTQIIFEQEKKNRSLLPLEALRKIIQSGGVKIAAFVQSSIETGIHQAREGAEKYLEKIRTPLENVSSLPTLQAEIRRLYKKIEELERRLKKYEQ